jgi:hypothetical protein
MLSEAACGANVILFQHRRPGFAKIAGFRESLAVSLIRFGGFIVYLLHQTPIFCVAVGGGSTTAQLPGI